MASNLNVSLYGMYFPSHLQGVYQHKQPVNSTDLQKYQQQKD